MQSKNGVSPEGEKISFSEGGGGRSIVFGPKYRPMPSIYTFANGLFYLRHRATIRQEESAKSKYLRVVGGKKNLVCEGGGGGGD